MSDNRSRRIARRVHRSRTASAAADNNDRPTLESLDPEVAAFIRLQPYGLTYSEITARVLETFGRERAWSRDRIYRYLNHELKARSGYMTRIDKDPELREFVEDRLGVMKLSEIIAACREYFGVDRAPSHSGLWRHHRKLLKRTR